MALVIGLVYNYCLVHYVVNNNGEMYVFFAILTCAVVFMMLLNIIYPSHIIKAIKEFKNKNKETDESV